MNQNFNPIGSYDEFNKNPKAKPSVGNNEYNFDGKKSIAPRQEDFYNNEGMKKSLAPNKIISNQNQNKPDLFESANFNNFGNLGFSTNNINMNQPNKMLNTVVNPPQNLYASERIPGQIGQVGQMGQIGLKQRPDYIEGEGPTCDFFYECDFDENGVFYYLGTLGKTCIYKNPHDIGQIKVFASSLGRGRLADFIGREVVNLRTLNEPYSFFGVDLGEDRTLIPTSYSIWNRNSSSHVLLGWQLEASNDRVNFNIIDTRIFASNDPKANNEMENVRNKLKLPGCTSTWGIDPQVGQSCPNGFRFFILKQIIKNSSGAYNMALSAFELYGRGLGKRWQFR